MSEFIPIAYCGESDVVVGCFPVLDEFHWMKQVNHSRVYFLLFNFSLLILYIIFVIILFDIYDNLKTQKEEKACLCFST